ncbi:matrixin family metalloprotease [Streptomyces sp. SID13031]|uniref:matrixin family metalloprotease n=1 Tax=Streptomyces sp. SID13031 TaxID=2706046 RepID=UPI0013C7E0DF|nr:matrixin family metalloprotease [Streptomyces sp. SID13031]NEA30239.1 hypothetical protein [Streptomyces sp. SID13031]
MKLQWKSKPAITLVIAFTVGIGALPVLATGGAVAATNPCRLPGGILHSEALATHSAVECGAVGRLVDAGDGVALTVQQPGESVTMDLLYPSGARTYSSTTDEKGLVSVAVQTPAKHQPTNQFPDLAGPGACDRDTYELRDYKWRSPWLFRTTWGTKLATNRQSDFDAAVRRSLANMTQGKNTCGLRGKNGASGALLGHTARQGNFLYADGQTTCGKRDRHSVIDEGDLPGGSFEATLAWTCTWSETRHGVTRAVEADIRMNSADYEWTYDPANDPKCIPALPPEKDRWRYDVESVLTHEMGHVYGLVNLSAVEDLNLTMYPGVRRCTGHMRTLGSGDVLGMQALYGRR